MGYHFYITGTQVIVYDDFWTPAGSFTPPAVITLGAEGLLLFEGSTEESFSCYLSEILSINEAAPAETIDDLMLQFMDLFVSAIRNGRPGPSYEYMPMGYDDPYGKLGDIAYYGDLMFIKTDYGWMYQYLGWM